MVPTHGSRYDVDLKERKLHAVYWTEEPFPVRRGTWFYKSFSDVAYTPYEEALAEKIEVSRSLGFVCLFRFSEWRHSTDAVRHCLCRPLQGEYKLICRTGEWQKRIDLPNGETIVFHNKNQILHYETSNTWTAVTVR